MCNVKQISRLAVCVLLFGVGCSEDDEGPAGPPGNAAPTITFTLDKLAVAKSSNVTLTVDVDDADSDPVTVEWEVTRGVLDTLNQGNPSMLWSTAGTVGTDTVTITASDGKGGERTIAEILEVGTAWKTNIPLTASATWSLAAAPHIVAPNLSPLTVIGSLTIEPGVVVYIDEPGERIDVEGRLTANGTTAAPVVVKPNARNPQAGFWEGFLGAGAGAAVLDLQNVSVSHAQFGIRGTNRSSLYVINCEIKVCSDIAISHEAFGRLIVEDCSITDNDGGGIRVKLASRPDSSITIRRNRITFNGRFQDSQVYPNGEAGITIDLSDPSGSVLIEISRNEIARNDFPGIRLGTGVYPRMTRNGIFGNEFRKSAGKINLELLAPFGGTSPSIDASDNWWGQVYDQPLDSLLIKDGIVDADHKDAPSGVDVSVWVTPWLTSWSPP
jgi:hypothetical protein